ncbi:MAG: hypothetical protein ACPG4Z_05980 [Chitinophagales bacterium]
MRKTIAYNILLLLVAFGNFVPLVAQSDLVSFGQNRVQYRDFLYQYYETDNFNVYFYQGGQDIGKYVILSSEKQMEEIVEKLDFRLSNKIDIIVYNDISDLHQTNIGIKSDDEKVSGTTTFLDNKLFLYFNGEHAHIDEQIRTELARLYVQKMLQGSGFTEVITNAVLLNLPEWFTEGLVAYAGKEWSTDYENELRDGILSGEFRDLSKLSNEQMSFVGHSIWNYVDEQYGENAIPNLLYLTRVNRSLDRGFIFVAGKGLDDFLEEWYYHYLDRFQQEEKDREAINEDDFVDIKQKDNKEYYAGEISPDGTKIAYVENEIGRWKLKVYDLEEEKTTTLLKGGFKTNTLVTDHSNPMIAWEPRGHKLTVIYEKKDLFHLADFTVEDWKKEETHPMRKFQKVFGFSYGEDSKNLVVSAMQKGQIDVFNYYVPQTKVTNLTNDFYDDLQPHYVSFEGREGVLFISNRKTDTLGQGRLDTILPNGTFDVFFYDMNNSIQPLAQVTHTPFANESHPQQYDDENYTFLSDADGINNRYIGELEKVKVKDRIKYVFSTIESPAAKDSVVLDQDIVIDSAMAAGQTLGEVYSQSLVPVYRVTGKNYQSSNYYKGIESISYANRTEQMLESLLYNGQTKFLLSEMEKNEANVIPTDYMQLYEAENAIDTVIPSDSTIISIYNEDTVEVELVPKEIIYQSKFDGWEDLSEAHQEALKNEGNADEETGDGYEFHKTRQHFLKFKTEDVTFGLDNSLLVSQYQPFNPGNPVYNQAPINAMMRFGVTDLFENHKIHGGFRIPFDFNTTEVYVTYENYKKRWDKSLTYYRRAEKQELDFLPEEDDLPIVLEKISTRTNLVESSFKYPFNTLNSLRFKFGFRNDRIIYKATDINTLNTPNQSQNWLIARAEFVHDHTIQIEKNIRNGFRVNVFYEFQKEIPTREDTLANQAVQLPQFNNSYLMHWGFDARYYQKVYKTITWANRIAYSTSVGKKKMVYYLGSTQGELFPTFDTETPVNLENNYAYQSLAYNMRGFNQNVRNGNSYAVINSELRIPIFSAFAKKQVKSPILQQLQIIGFADFGTAWEGLSPFSEDNTTFVKEFYNTDPSITDPSAIVRVKERISPFVMGFGTGLRTYVFGYYIRADVGWGFDSGNLSKANFNLSLGLDF